MNPFNIFLVYPIINALVLIYKILFAAHVPYALGFAIIGLTTVIRLILYPLTASQLRSAKKMQGVSHHISKLKEKHKGDSKRIQEETMKLYKEHGINPAAGCLPVVVQIPIIWSLYAVLENIVKLSPSQVVSYVNKIVYSPSLNLIKSWDTTFFSLPLGQNPAHLLSTMGPAILLIPVVTGVLQYFQSKMLLPQKEEGKKEKKSAKKETDFASTFQSQSTYIFPIMIGFFSYTFPLGLSLYWNTFTIFGIIQQYKVSGLGGLSFKK